MRLAITLIVALLYDGYRPLLAEPLSERRRRLCQLVEEFDRLGLEGRGLSLERPLPVGQDDSMMSFVPCDSGGESTHFDELNHC